MKKDWSGEIVTNPANDSGLDHIPRGARVVVEVIPPTWPHVAVPKQRTGGCDETPFSKSFPPDKSFRDALDRLLDLQENCGWSDYLLSVIDAVSAVYMLAAGNHGAYAVLESNDPFMRWIWLDPKANQYVRENGVGMLDGAVDASIVSAQDEYQFILKDLGRDSKGRKLS